MSRRHGNCTLEIASGTCAVQLNIKAKEKNT